MLSVRRLTRTVIVIVVASVFLSACSSDAKESKEQKALEVVQAKFGEEGLIRAEIVVRAYEEGRLGTREQVEADMEPYFSPPDFQQKVPKPFDSSGKLIPLTEMSDEQIHAFSQWFTSGKVYTTLRDEMTAAITASREKKGAKKG
jgi:hypothetical protein